MRSRFDRSTPPRPGTAGFTLIEILTVIVIIGILMMIFLPMVRKAMERGQTKITSGYLKQLSAAISEYELRFGDYPPSTFLEKWGSPPNATNMGAETLVLSLWSPEWGGTSLADDKLVNTDKDETTKALAKFPKTSLFELKDQWDNPIAYFHHRDYGREDSYVTVAKDASDTGEGTVKAVMNPMTKTYYNPTSYQLISAGPDGEFGTADDIGNFEAPTETDTPTEPMEKPVVRAKPDELIKPAQKK